MAQTPDGGRPGGPTVFLSYAHDDDDHVATVLELAGFLESRGIAVELDTWYADRRRDWYAWMLREIQAADFVVVVASPMYRAVGDGTAPDDLHRGVQAETAVLRDLLYRDRQRWLGRVLPVVLPGRTLDELPTFTQPYPASNFRVGAITDEGLEALLRVLTGQPRHVRPPRGAVPALPRGPSRAHRSPWPRARPRVVHEVALLVLTLLLIGVVIALPGDSVRDEAVDHGTAASSSPGAPGGGPDAGLGDRENPLPGTTASGAEGRGAVEIVAVGHSFATGVDRLTVTVRNTRAEPVLIEEIAVYMDNLARGHDWSDPGGMWHFSVSADMYAGAPGFDGARRTHGLIRMNGTAFSFPLVGQGYIGDEGTWRRLLTFAPQRFLAGAETTAIAIDLPTTHLLQKTADDEPAGPMVEVELDPARGALFTRVDLSTADDRSFACDHLRRREDNPVCGSVDPAAAVTLPR